MNADATAGRFRLRQAIGKWLAEVAAERPVAVVLDDLHWADTATLELLGGGLGLRAPILVVAAYRADESGHLTEMPASLARAAPLRLALPGLSDEAVAELVRTECEADEETIAGIAERTGGNPFYVRESARLLTAKGRWSPSPRSPKACGTSSAAGTRACPREPPGVLRRMRLPVRPDTVLRWHRDLIAGRHAARSKQVTGAAAPPAAPDPPQ